ncbi:MAG: zinc ribbon domain-containing protein [Halobacteriota archaeon]
MPYCQNCGTKNDEGAEICVNCRQPLYDTRRRRARRDGCYGPRGEQRHEEECFGLPYGGAIVGILFGLILLISGVAWVLSLTLGISFNGALVGPLIAIAIAILIIAGAIYQLRHRK